MSTPTDDVPFPEGCKVLASADLSDEMLTSISVNVKVSMWADDVAAFYDESLSS